MSQSNVITSHRNLQAALALSDAGVPVFPFHLVPNPKPGKDPIKKPCFTGWQDQATTDKARLRRWFAKHPERMPGIVTGPRTGWAVLDVDHTRYTKAASQKIRAARALVKMTADRK